MEDRGKQEKSQSELEVQLRREKLEFGKEQLYFKERKRIEREKYKGFLKEREDKPKIN